MVYVPDTVVCGKSAVASESVFGLVPSPAARVKLKSSGMSKTDAEGETVMAMSSSH